MVEIAVRRGRQLQRSEADVVQSLVVDAESFVGVLDELVDRHGGVVRLDDRIRHLQENQTTISVTKCVRDLTQERNSNQSKIISQVFQFSLFSVIEKHEAPAQPWIWSTSWPEWGNIVGGLSRNQFTHLVPQKKNL